MKIEEILTQEEINSLVFEKSEITWLENRIKQRKDGKFGVECIVRGTNNDEYFELGPEEIVRQIVAYQLIEKHNYPKERLDFETKVTFHGHEKSSDKRIDIAIYDKEHKNIEIVIEVKRPSVKDITKKDDEGASPLEQLQSYCKQVAAKIGVIVNGANVLKFYESPKFEKELSISNYPKAGQELDEWKRGERWTILELMQNDRLQNETLKNIIADVEQRFAANDSSDKSFEELLKLIFVKLYDERSSGNNATNIEYEINKGKKQGKTEAEILSSIDSEDFRPLEFRIRPGENMEETFNRLDNVFIAAQTEWSNVFTQDSHFNMQPETLTSCVRELEKVKLFNSNLEVIDDAFENLVNKNQKDEMGQYFTPRYVIDMCVKMLNPQPHEKMIDTASGSAGFPMHTVFHVWKQLSPNKFNLMTTPDRSVEETTYVKNNVFGLDFSEKSVQVGRMLNIIAGDGHANVIYINSLDYKNWEKTYKKNTNWYAK